MQEGEGLWLPSMLTTSTLKPDLESPIFERQLRTERQNRLASNHDAPLTKKTTIDQAKKPEALNTSAFEPDGCLYVSGKRGFLARLRRPVGSRDH